jgi:endoglycosylceramidase
MRLGYRVAGVSMAGALLLAMTVVDASPGSGTRLVSHWSRTACPVNPALAVDACGKITAPGMPGGFLRDGFGRDVIMHGVNAVYKTYPFDFSPVAGLPNSLTATDAAHMASLGFDVVRLGIIWEGLEPGLTEDYAEPATAADDNNPAICTEGLVQGAGTAGQGGSASQYSYPTLQTYLAKVKATVDLLARYGIYSLVDMHQDVYNAHFAGEGAPDWAVCTNGLPPTNTGNWSANYFTPAVGVAFDHFWDNDVVGGLQQNYDAVWHQVASTLAGDPGVVGYDVFNEPFSSEIATVAGNAVFDAKLECFYTGTSAPGEQSETHAPLVCPPTDPAVGAVPSIESGDPNHLVFYEPDVGNDFGDANYIGPMPYPNLVLGFHDYCLASDGQAYFDFYGSPFCSEPEQMVMQQESAARASAATTYQPGGPAWFMSEFGAGEDTTDLTRVTSLANANLLGWTYWQWKQYGDPTGGSTEALVRTDGSVDPVKAAVIVQPYAQAVAGTPTSMSYDPSTHDYALTFTPDPTIAAPTVVFVPVNSFYDAYPSGYCATASGATSTTAGDKVLLTGPTARTVTLTITPGSCLG